MSRTPPTQLGRGRRHRGADDDYRLEGYSYAGGGRKVPHARDDIGLERSNTRSKISRDIVAMLQEQHRGGIKLPSKPKRKHVRRKAAPPVPSPDRNRDRFVDQDEALDAILQGTAGLSAPIPGMPPPLTNAQLLTIAAGQGLPMLTDGPTSDASPRSAQSRDSLLDDDGDRAMGLNVPPQLYYSGDNTANWFNTTVPPVPPTGHSNVGHVKQEIMDADLLKAINAYGNNKRNYQNWSRDFKASYGRLPFGAKTWQSYAKAKARMIRKVERENLLGLRDRYDTSNKAWYTPARHVKWKLRAALRRPTRRRTYTRKRTVRRKRRYVRKRKGRRRPRGKLQL